MNKIERFNLPEHTNKLYTSETISSISLTRDVADKINELVDAYNRFSETDLAWKHEEEGRIRKGVVYMKDNLLNSLNDLMVALRDSGFIDDRIEFHCNNLNERLTNLLGSVTSGSTTLDAEVIDGRVSVNGETYGCIGNAIRGQMKNLAYTVKEVVTSANYSTVLPDANLIDEPCTYQLNFNYNAESLTANLPYTIFKGSIDELITFKDKYYRQILIGDDYIYTRKGVKQADGKIAYTDGWKCLFDRAKDSELKAKSYKSKGVVTSADYLTILPDANKILENCIYQLNFNYGSAEITANLPFEKFTGRLDELITFADKYFRQILISDKYIYTRNGILSNSLDSVNYGEWVLIWSPTTANERVFTVSKNGGGDYTSLTKCVFDNVGTKNTIYVKAGNYNLIEEFKSYFGENVFLGDTLAHHGIPVTNGTKFIMDSGAEVSFLYDGVNSIVEEYFSPFIMKDDGGEIYGGKIICTNCRYAIHDDVYANSPRSKSTIEGVYIHYTSNRNVGIGGGVGQSSHITVKNCVIINGNDLDGYGIFYHNSATGNSQSYITIENNYVTDKIIIEPYGTSTNISVALVTGNKCSKVEKVMGGEIDNIVLYAFNNVEGV